MYSPNDIRNLIAQLHRAGTYTTGLDELAYSDRPRGVGVNFQSGCSTGTFSYHTVGASLTQDTPKTDEWAGGCFACWSSIPVEFYMTEMRYCNPLPNLLIPNGTNDFLELGWDTVIRPPFGANLPTFAELKEVPELVFRDVPHRSLMEASLYFRLARAFSECLSFVTTAAVLRNRYPTTSAPVLLALTAFSPVRDGGITGSWHPASPNCTIQGGLNIQFAIAMLRNWLWSTEQGGWDIAQLRIGQDTAGPHTRRYFGHNWWWFGAGPTFSTDVTIGGKKQAHHARSRIWDPLLAVTRTQGSDGDRDSARVRSASWQMLDELELVLREAETMVQSLSPADPFTWDIPMNAFTHIEEAFKQAPKTNW